MTEASPTGGESVLRLGDAQKQWREPLVYQMVDDPSLDRVRDYYAQFGERERNRLANPDDGVIEFAITRRTLRKYLPPSGRILDIGGGPGRYAIWLAENGYRVALADLSPNFIEIAKSKVSEAGLESKIESISVADARDLSDWEDNSFDGVPSLGPFYHLVNATDREEAAKELQKSWFACFARERLRSLR